MRIRLLSFASAADVLGPARDLELPAGTTIGTLADRLATEHPALAPLLPYVAWSVDGALVRREATLAEGAEVGLLPPVSGG
jgi:molybdopterin converting factor small subunit